MVFVIPRRRASLACAPETARTKIRHTPRALLEVASLGDVDGSHAALADLAEDPEGADSRGERFGLGGGTTGLGRPAICVHQSTGNGTDGVRQGRSLGAQHVEFRGEPGVGSGEQPIEEQLIKTRLHVRWQHLGRNGHAVKHYAAMDRTQRPLRGGSGRQSEVEEDPADRFRLEDGGEEPALTAAAAEEDVEEKDAAKEFGPGVPLHARWTGGNAVDLDVRL